MTTERLSLTLEGKMYEADVAWDAYVAARKRVTTTKLAWLAAEAKVRKDRESQEHNNWVLTRRTP